jgi:uncharacterized protein YjbI with pentapeptide repeats
MLESILNLTPEQKRQVEKEIGPLQSVTEFCSSLLEATKEIPLKDKLAGLLPWAVKGGKIVSEITPLAKVLVKILDEVAKEKDPETLGLLACSLAYQRSAALALTQQGEPRNRVPFQDSLHSAGERLKKLNVGVNLTGLSLEAPLAHPFVWQADDSLSLVVRSTGYSDTEWRHIQRRVHNQFGADLVEILSHGESAARFEPFTKRLSLGDNAAAYTALNAHIERQRWLFENRPVLNVEPFTLDDVYVDTDCGKLQWKDFPSPNDSRRSASGKRFDPFSEQFGGRHPLLETVLDYFRDPKFNDAIVVQGAPGCGKSSFTLRLANALRREGLRPLRIRLKFLDLKKNLSEALAQVVLQPEEDENLALDRLPQCSDPFLNDSIFQERTKFGDAEICPYVLILDGWDEISVAVNEGFEIEVHRMLRNVREQFLRPRAVKVRVLLTGRPSHAVERSQFLRDDTPLLTVREYTPDQLESYAAKVKTSLDHSKLTAGAETWPDVNWNNLKGVFATYRKNKNKLDILGLPLLAHLSLRLLAQWKGETEELLFDRTALYRHLLDLTCVKAGKESSDPDDLLGQARIRGLELRRMLQQTAVAITAFGSESISFRELQYRLKKSRKQAMEEAENAGKERPLTSLMISFYFKGGREHLGCEFLHKSFREYLYAEAIVEALKEYGRIQSDLPGKREAYWKDFQESDPRHQFSRHLSQILCPYPFTAELLEYISSLLVWEIERSRAKEAERQLGQSLQPATFQQWEIIRDCLNDLWDWWGEGVHLRSQPYRDDSDNLHYFPAFVNELLDYSLPRDRGPDALEWWPGRLLNADANVGDALCRLNAWVHASLLKASGWNGILEKREDLKPLPGTGQRPYQSRFQRSESVFVLFRPSGSAAGYFRNYCSRINSTGNRSESFPGLINLSHLDLSGAELRGSNLMGTNLIGADLTESNLSNANLSRANLSNANLSRANFSKADLSEASLNGAALGEANLNGSNLSKIDLSEANLRGADLRGANLNDANLSKTNLSNAKLSRADLSGADLSRADLSGADLSEANLSMAVLNRTNLKGANFQGIQRLTQEQLASAIHD